MECFGARNTRGFTSQIEEGELPDQNHLTFEGVFNQLRFDVGPKTKKLVDLHCGYARYQFSASLHDKQINDYLAIFFKGANDGAQRDARNLNALICLDISGSMGGGLGVSKGKFQSRLTLSLEAIKMFISKLRPTDSVGLITFDDEAYVIFEPTLRENISDNIFDELDKIKTKGGTTIRSGFDMSKKLLLKYLNKNENSNCQNRIILLTDIGDNSIENEKRFIEQASADSNIHLTIIGISNQFKSQVCECLKNVKGFNYFCAVNQQDIKKYVFETFDFGFFPSAFDLCLKISSDQVSQFQVFGAPDSDLVATYNNNFKQKQQEYTITKVKSTFPSEIEIEHDKVYTFGGLVLIKLKNNSPNCFKGKLTLNYSNPQGIPFQQQYNLEYQFHATQQFFSDDSLREALQAFTFASEIKNMLKANQSTKDKRKLYESYLSIFDELSKIVPPSKIKQLEDTKKIMEQNSKYSLFAKLND